MLLLWLRVIYIVFYLIQSEINFFFEGESQEKHCGLLLIYKKGFILEPIKLQTVRPFVFKAIDLLDYEDELSGNAEFNSQELCCRIVKEMIEDAKKKVYLNQN